MTPEQQAREIAAKHFSPAANALSDYYRGFLAGASAALKEIERIAAALAERDTEIERWKFEAETTKSEIGTLQADVDTYVREKTNALLAERDLEIERLKAVQYTCTKCGYITVTQYGDALRAQRDALVEALDRLYRETVDYITINHLGDPHHNQSMKMARAALAAGKDMP